MCLLLVEKQKKIYWDKENFKTTLRARLLIINFISYLALFLFGGANVFDALVEKAKNDDEKALEEVVESLKPLVIASIRRYYNKPQEYDDLIQDGNLRIIESIYEYNKSKQVHFLGFIKMNLKFLYLDKHKQKFHLSLDENIGEDDDSSRMDYLVSDEVDFLESIVDEENRDLVEKALDTLTEKQRKIIEMFYWKDMAIGEIAEELGLAYRTVVNTRSQAMEKMRKAVKS